MEIAVTTPNPLQPLVVSFQRQLQPEFSLSYFSEVLEQKLLLNVQDAQKTEFRIKLRNSCSPTPKAH